MISQHATLNTAPNWTLVSSEILTANEGRLVRRTVYSNGSLETRVHIEPVLSDDRPGTDPEGNSPRYRAA